MFQYGVQTFNWTKKFITLQLDQKIKYEQSIGGTKLFVDTLNRNVSYVGNFWTSKTGKTPELFTSMKIFFDTSPADPLPQLGTLKESPESVTNAFAAFETPFVEFSDPEENQYSPFQMLCELTDPYADVDAHFFKSNPWNNVFSIFVAAEYVQLINFTEETDNDKHSTVQFYFKSVRDTSTSSSMATAAPPRNGPTRATNPRRSGNNVGKKTQTAAQRKQAAAQKRKDAEETQKHLDYLMKMENPLSEHNIEYCRTNKKKKNFKTAYKQYYEKRGRQAGYFKSGKLSTIDSTTTVVLTGHGVAEYIDSVANSKIPGIETFDTREHGFKPNTLYSGKAKVDDMLVFLYMAQNPTKLKWSMMDVLCAFQYRKWNFKEGLVQDPRVDPRFDMQKFDATWLRTKYEKGGNGVLSNGYKHALRMIDELLLLKSLGVQEVYLLFAK
jgi:hypothetical protein